MSQGVTKLRNYHSIMRQHRYNRKGRQLNDTTFEMLEEKIQGPPV